MTGDAYTLVSPEEEGTVRAIEHAVGRTIERRRIEGFDYDAAAEAKLEVPQRERIAAIRARKADDRARAAVNATRRENGGGRNGNTRSAGVSAANGNSATSNDSAGDAASRPSGRGRRRRGSRGRSRR